VTVSSMVREMVGGEFAVRDNPQVDAQFSIPYTVAVALKLGKPRLEDFSKERIENTWIQELTKKVVVIPSNNLPENDINSVSITITTQDKKTYTLNHDYLPGSPNTPMSTDASREKFYDCVNFSGRDDINRNAAKIIDRVLHLEEIDNLKQLTTLL